MNIVLRDGRRAMCDLQFSQFSRMLWPLDAKLIKLSIFYEIETLLNFLY